MGLCGVRASWLIDNGGVGTICGINIVLGTELGMDPDGNSLLIDSIMSRIVPVNGDV